MALADPELCSGLCGRGEWEGRGLSVAGSSDPSVLPCWSRPGGRSNFQIPWWKTSDLAEALRQLPASKLFQMFRQHLTSCFKSLPTGNAKSGFCFPN